MFIFQLFHSLSNWTIVQYNRLFRKIVLTVKKNVFSKDCTKKSPSFTKNLVMVIQNDAKTLPETQAVWRDLLPWIWSLNCLLHGIQRFAKKRYEFTVAGNHERKQIVYTPPRSKLSFEGKVKFSQNQKDPELIDN